MSTLKVDTILKRTGTGTITVGQSGDTISIPSGATLTVAGSTISSADMGPSFYATLSSSQTITKGATTKVQINTELYDSDNCYDNSSNYRFTPTTAGKYFVFGKIGFNNNQTNGSTPFARIYKNGSNYAISGFSNGNSFGVNTADVSAIVDMNGSSDYVELYGDYDGGTATYSFLGNSSYGRCWFGAYRILGV